MSGFIASSNKGRCLKSQTVSPQQGRRRIPVRSCLWHTIMALCNLARGQEGVGMLVVAHQVRDSQGATGGMRQSEKPFRDVTLVSATTFPLQLNGCGQMSRPEKVNHRPERRQVPWASVPAMEGSCQVATVGVAVIQLSLQRPLHLRVSRRP